MFDEDDEETLNRYIEMGAVEVSGIDESGEFIFQINEIAKDIAPELWESHERHIDQSLMALFDMGLINISYNEDLEAIIELTEEGKIKAKEFGLIPIDDFDIPND